MTCNVVDSFTTVSDCIILCAFVVSRSLSSLFLFPIRGFVFLREKIFLPRNKKQLVERKKEKRNKEKKKKGKKEKGKGSRKKKEAATRSLAHLVTGRKIDKNREPIERRLRKARVSRQR